MNRPTLVGLSPISPNGPAATAYLSTSMTFEQFRYVGTLQKFFSVLVWGPIFVGAPVRPNMLNMPKSASAYTHRERHNTLRHRQMDEQMDVLRRTDRRQYHAN